MREDLIKIANECVEFLETLGSHRSVIEITEDEDGGTTVNLLLKRDEDGAWHFQYRRFDAFGLPLGEWVEAGTFKSQSRFVFELSDSEENKNEV